MVLINVLQRCHTGYNQSMIVMSWVSIWEDGNPRKKHQLYLLEVLGVHCILGGLGAIPWVTIPLSRGKLSIVFIHIS